MNKSIQLKNKENEKIYPYPYYPIGAIYLSVDPTNPSTWFGGIWEQIKDCFLLSAGNSYAAGTTGGEAYHTLSISEMPSHNHTYRAHYGSNRPAASTLSWHLKDTDYNDYETEYTGGSQPHNNMPPYLAVYVWKRVR